MTALFCVDLLGYNVGLHAFGVTVFCFCTKYCGVQPAVTSKEVPLVSLVLFLAGAHKAFCLGDAAFQFSFFLFLHSPLVQNDGLMCECLDFIYAKIIFSIRIWVPCFLWLFVTVQHLNILLIVHYKSRLKLKHIFSPCHNIRRNNIMPACSSQRSTYYCL